MNKENAVDKPIVTVLLTCYNRVLKTTACIKSLLEMNKEVEFRFIVVDDNSSDGTPDELSRICPCMTIAEGNGNLFWAGGMRKAISLYLDGDVAGDYVLFVNDDVSFFPNAVSDLVRYSRMHKSPVVVGPVCGSDGEYSYGGIRIGKHRLKQLFEPVMCTDGDRRCDTFCCNCVLFEAKVIREFGSFDPVYTHSFADFDYGLMLSESNIPILMYDSFVGQCDDNSPNGTWRDPSLTRMERIRRKELPKGDPLRERWHFMTKHFALPLSIRYTFSPYIRIMLGK